MSSSPSHKGWMDGWNEGKKKGRKRGRKEGKEGGDSKEGTLVKKIANDYKLGEMSLLPLRDPAGRCLEAQGGGWSAFLSKRLLQAQLALAVVLRPLCQLPLTPGEGGPQNSLVNAVCGLHAGKGRDQASFGPRAQWLLEVSSPSETCFCLPE